MTHFNDFSAEVLKNVDLAEKDKYFLGLSNQWLRQAIRHNYAYNFSWLDRPIMQIPQDIYVIQELIWHEKPNLIIETGIAHGGSLMMSASMLALIDYCEAVTQKKVLDYRESKRCVLGVDIEIRSHNRKAIEQHPMAHLIKMIEGSSVASDVIEQVKMVAKDYKKIMIFLDSNHAHDHVLAELEAYAPLTSVGSYCVVWDTGIEDLPMDFYTNRPWNKGNNPKTAVWKYLHNLSNGGRTDLYGKPIKFEIDKFIEHKLMITAAPDGYLKRIQ